MKVLVIDDSRAMRMILRTALVEQGHEVAEAADGRQGLECLSTQGPFQIALVDWNMPNMNGYEFVVAVRAMEQHKPMKIMMVTTEVETAQVVKALSAGADEYVMKPFTKDVLAEKLQMLAAA
jgi:two-component system chemotaxis response regulator CheY